MEGIADEMIEFNNLMKKYEIKTARSRRLFFCDENNDRGGRK